MKIKKTKFMLLFIFTLFILINTNTLVSADNVAKTIVIVTDNLDFDIAGKLNIDREMSLGLMNTRTANVFRTNSESYFMTMATGRRVNVAEDLFEGVSKDAKGELTVNGYKDILIDLDNKYTDFSREIDFLADTLIDNGVEIGYIGNDASALIATDRNGIIHFGDNTIEYDENWLINKTDDILKQTDVLVISYDINNNNDRLKILSNYINKYNTYNIIAFPKEISGDINYKRNITLVPILYNEPNNAVGILTSDSTKREGLITNMDIFVELADIYDIPLTVNIGHKINSISSSEIIEKNRNNLVEYLNLIIIKYVFHGIVIIVQLYILYDILKRKRKNYHRYNVLMNGIIISIFLSIILGIFNLQRNIFLYCSVLIALSAGLTVLMNRKSINSLETFSILSNITILIVVFFKPDIIYNSFFGFNNVVSGGRFYGLNNEAMGVLLATSLITFFTIKKRINNRIGAMIVLIVYFPIVIFALSGRYAANFGGYLTSISLFLMLLYSTVFNKKANKRNLLVLVTIGFCILVFNLYFDFISASGSHAGGLVARIKILGFYELLDMIIKKVKQLVLMTITPPWSIIFISQIYFIRRFFISEGELLQKAKRKDADIVKNLYIMFIISFVAFILNDTGVVAFVYMNTYLVASLISLHNTK